ncbi:energy-coupling factor ABC transporter ATP-binding protein [Halorarum salinum]|uniref:ABC transporter ATP-binding protein n=1 Tax=Halorarum salinum TaxID=2743089 RepID=A0A7D5Q7W0_9EURY|nr:ABC transporter ATP-binding protein [Halobaculum salinum]QLG60356.1 ABC transporter ATP-binding protein [Halobaculum salinum]
MKAIEIEGLSFQYRNQEAGYALEDVSLNVEEGEFLGIVGETGAGKTTLLSAMSGVIPHHTNGEKEGVVHVKGKPVEEYASLYEMAVDVSLVLDSPENQLFNLHVFDEIIWGPENLGLDREEILDRGNRALELFGLEGFEDRITYNLSGGEKQKVAIASIYALNPDIVLLDEPTSQLDPIGTEMVFEAIDKLIEEGVTIVMVEHKIEEMAKYADRIAVLQDGSLRRVDETCSFFLEGDAHGIAPPQVTELGQRLREAGVDDVAVPLTLNESIDEYTRLLQRRGIK